MKRPPRCEGCSETALADKLRAQRNLEVEQSFPFALAFVPPRKGMLHCILLTAARGPEFSRPTKHTHTPRMFAVPDACALFLVMI